MGIWVSSKDVVIQSTTSPLFQYFLIEELKTDLGEATSRIYSLEDRM